MDVIVLVDGEHYPPVVKAALDELRKSHNVKAAVFLGGTEKIKLGEDVPKTFGLPVYMSGDVLGDIAAATKAHRPQAAVDLSDEPVIDYDGRFSVATELSLQGVDYIGADFRFNALKFREIFTKPSLNVIGTGKRIGKTAVSGYVCRTLRDSGYDVVAVTMGRGGPAAPELIEGKTIRISPEYLLKEAEAGKHASSDHYEDALTSRVTTIGCRRCGGGMMGAPFFSVVEEGCVLAQSLPNDFVVLEGSGATFAPVKTDWTVTVAGANQPAEHILKYFGRLRLRLADIIVLTQCEEPMASREKVGELYRGAKETNPEAAVVRTVFRPKPLSDISGRKVFYATTAADGSEGALIRYLEGAYGCKVAGYSNRLSDRPQLMRDLEGLSGAELLLTELKAASVDIATKCAVGLGKQVVYCDNIPVSSDGDLGRTVLKMVGR
jgi:cyclic 2,3-diphosphoglycerate synthase